MAPTICMPDFPTSPTSEKSQSYSRRRHKNQDGSISKRQRPHLKNLSARTPDNSEMCAAHPLCPVSRPMCPMNSFLPIDLRSSPRISTRVPSMQNEEWRTVLRRDGLLDIFVRTMALVKSNHILQIKVNALREETQNFISSMSRNKKNKTIEIEDLSGKENYLVSSSTEISSKSSSPSLLQSKTDSETNGVSSSSDIDDREDTDC